jgi:hypothetical protein
MEGGSEQQRDRKKSVGDSRGVRKIEEETAVNQVERERTD